MKAYAALGALLTLLASAAVASAEPTGAPALRAGRFAIPPSALQLIVVSSASASAGGEAPGDLAALSAFSRVGASSRWQREFGPWHAEVGYGGIRTSRHEGDGSTPAGVFGIGATIFGNQANPGGLHYPYHRLVCGDWWDEDPYSRSYNRFVHVRCGVTPPFAPGSEALWTETRAYPYFAVVDFNVDPTVGGARARGSGIFLHSWIGEPTHGCVALRQGELLSLLRWLRPAQDPVIEIGTSAQVYSGR